MKATCTCTTCGYTWPRGRDGSHSCAEGLSNQINALKAEIKTLRNSLNSEIIRHCDELKIIYKMIDSEKLNNIKGM